jgi:hypothetical protein
LFETARSFKIYVVESLEPIKRARDALRRPHAGYRRHNDRDDFRSVGWMPTFGSGETDLAEVQNRS